MIAGAAPPVYGMSASTYQVLCEHLGFADTPAVLPVTPRGFWESERHLVVDSGWRELRDIGLVTQRGIADKLVTMINALYRFDYAIDARLYLNSKTRALAAVNDGVGVLAVLANDRFTVRAVHPDRLCAAVVGLLPDVAAGQGDSLAVPRSTLDAAASGAGANDSTAFQAQLRIAGVCGADATELGRMLGQPLRRGNFGVTVSTAQGSRLRGDHVLAWVDTADGRYLIENSTALDGVLWTTVAPATPARLIGQVTWLLQTTLEGAGVR